MCVGWVVCVDWVGFGVGVSVGWVGWVEGEEEGGERGGGGWLGGLVAWIVTIFTIAYHPWPEESTDLKDFGNKKF